MALMLESGLAPSVLVVGADEWVARTVELILSAEGYAVMREHSARDAFAHLQDHAADAVILALDLRDADALELCRSLREDGLLSPATPIVVTAPGAPTRQDRLAALRAGVTEVVSQPPDTEEFLLRLATNIRTKRRLEHAHAGDLIDPATGLYTSHGLAHRARELAALADRTQAPLACVVLAVDALASQPSARDLGRVLHGLVRQADAPGWLGGVNFAVLAPNTPSDAAGAMARRLSRSLEELLPGGAVRTGRAGSTGHTDLVAAALASLAAAPAP